MEKGKGKEEQKNEITMTRKEFCQKFGLGGLMFLVMLVLNPKRAFASTTESTLQKAIEVEAAERKTMDEKLSKSIGKVNDNIFTILGTNSFANVGKSITAALGNTSLAGIGDGTISGSISSLNNNLTTLSIGEWKESSTYNKFIDTSISNGQYGRIVITSEGELKTYKIKNSIWTNTSYDSIRKIFPNYRSGTKLTDSTKTQIPIPSYGYIRVSSWWNNGYQKPMAELFINGSLIYETGNTVETQVGILYPVSPDDIVDFYLNQGGGDVWFFPCKGGF